MTTSAAPDRTWRVDFSLALFNRSGKYQIGQEIIAHNRDLIENVWYWRYPAPAPPRGIAARLLGKAEKIEHDWRIRAGRWPSAIARRHRWLHIDPLTLLHRPAAAQDIVLVHDMGPLTHPELFAPDVGRAYDAAFRQLVHSGAQAVFVSFDAQRQHAHLYGAPERAQVIYPPIATRLSVGKQQRPAGLGDNFLLTVGAIGSRKNQARAIAAFAASGLAAEGFEYALCGSREPGHEQVVALAQQTAGVRLLPFVGDDELRWLYGHAAGFVLPSLLEGFGMPVAEAMAFGLVPIVSRGTVLTEVAGKAALEVAPDNIGEMAAAMRQLAGLDPIDRSSRQAEMARSLGRFSLETFQDSWRGLLAGQ